VVSATSESAYPGDLKNHYYGPDQVEVERPALSTLLSFVDVGVKIDVGDVAVKHRPSGLDHAIRELWADTYGMSEALSDEKGKCERQWRTRCHGYA
jgi:hypothetical protein